MAKVNLHSIKDCDTIYCNGEYVVLCGKSLYILRTNEEFVAKVPLKSNVLKLVFLKENTVLLTTASRFYYHISLCDGKILWRQKITKTMGNMSLSFAVSPNRDCAYDILEKFEFTDKKTLYALRIDPKNQKLWLQELPKGYRVTLAFNWDCDDCLRVVEFLADKDPLKEGEYYATSATSKWGVLQLPDGGQPSWQYRWEGKIIFDEGKKPMPHHYGNGYLLYDDKRVLKLSTGQITDLLENDPAPRRMCDSFEMEYNEKKNYLTLTYLLGRDTEVIDCSARKRIAYYPRIDYCAAFGCIVGDEFWIGTRDGILRRPFPNLEVEKEDA